MGRFQLIEMGLGIEECAKFLMIWESSSVWESLLSMMAGDLSILVLLSRTESGEISYRWHGN